MQIKLFTIPINSIEDYNEELNKFLGTHKIVEIEKHLLQTANTYSWCFYISYIKNNYTDEQKKSKGRIDYMKTLDSVSFAKFSKLRDIRKKIAIENAVSAYIVFTDAELAEMTKLPEITIQKIKRIKGIGDKKAEKYGNKLIENYYKKVDETSGESNSGDKLF